MRTRSHLANLGHRVVAKRFSSSTIVPHSRKYSHVHLKFNRVFDLAQKVNKPQGLSGQRSLVLNPISGRNRALIGLSSRISQIELLSS